MRHTGFLRTCLVLVLAAAGCQDPTTAPTRASAPSRAAGRPQVVVPGTAWLDRARITLPPSARMTDQHAADAARRAIDPNDYVCNPSSPVIDWYNAKVDEVIAREPAIFNLLYYQLLADLVPTYEALYFQTTATPQYFGYDGEYSHVLRKTERDAKRFWDVRSDDIQMVGMHGSMLLDARRVAATYEAVFGVPTALAEYYASVVRDAVLASSTLDGGDHPLFSFNAFAFSTFGGPVPDKIVMGDGILAGYEAVGYGDVAPQAVYAHEFGHHIQFENDYFNDPLATTGDQAERTRYTELMADAYSAYYLTHKRGATMNRKRVEQFLQVFFQIGDCGFAFPGHHGTPNQRLAAARFGFDVADQAQKQGHILTSDQFHDLFVAAYPRLVAPDAR